MFSKVTSKEPSLAHRAINTRSAFWELGASKRLNVMENAPSPVSTTTHQKQLAKKMLQPKKLQLCFYRESTDYMDYPVCCVIEIRNSSVASGKHFGDASERA
jgi:hypothetical protein